MSDTIHVDDLKIQVRRSLRRANVGLTVERDGSVVVAVPDAMKDEDVTRLIRNKQTWIYTTLGRKQATHKGPPSKEYVSGEGFFYLGRKYRLKVLRDGQTPEHGPGLQLKHDRFYLPSGQVSDGRNLFLKWYSERAAEWITKRMNALKARVAASPHGIEIRDLGFRWASCTHKGKMYFHWRTILLPPERIDYLIFHELVHLHEHNHSPTFYERLRRASPDFKQHEDWFRRYGDLYSL